MLIENVKLLITTAIVWLGENDNDQYLALKILLLLVINYIFINQDTNTASHLA